MYDKDPALTAIGGWLGLWLIIFIIIRIIIAVKFGGIIVFSAVIDQVLLAEVFGLLF